MTSRIDRLYIFCAVSYFAQGMCGIAYEPVNYLLKDGLRLSAGEAAGFVAWMTLPFMIKPLLGLLTDLVPLAGGLRRPHLAVGAALGSACWLALALLPRPAYWPLLALLTAVNLSVVFCDVVCDGVMVEAGKSNGKTGTYQAVQIGTLYLTIVLTGVGGGWLAAHASMRAVFALTAAFPLLIALCAAWVPRTRRPDRGEGLRGLGRMLSSRHFWVLCLMICLWNFYPFLGTAQFYYQSETLHFGPVYIGVLSTFGGLAGVGGAAFFGANIRRWGTAAFLRAGILVGGLATLLYLFYLGPVSAAVITMLLGFLGVAFRLALMDLAAQSCPRGAEATAFALYMAAFNAAALASNTFGGRFYDWARTAAHFSAAPAYAAFSGLVLIGAACTLSCWFLLPALDEART